MLKPSSLIGKDPVTTWLRHLPRVAGGITALLGFIAVIGWQAHWRLAVQWLSGSAPMHYNTALCFILLGAGLMLLTARYQKYAPWLGGAAATLASLTLLQYALGRDFRIDLLFSAPFFEANRIHSGRMSAITAFCIISSGLGIVIAGGGNKWRHRATGTGLLASIVLMISVVALLGFTFGIQAATGWGAYARMALNSAIVLFCLGGGLFVWSWSVARAESVSFSRWVPVAGSVTLIVMIILVSAGSLAALKHAIFWRGHTYQVLNTAGALVGCLTDTQRGMRGYLLTTSPEALELYRRATNSAPRQLAQLAELTRDDPAQQKNVTTLTADVAAVIGYSRQLLSLNDHAGLPAAMQLEKTGRGLAVMNCARADLDVFTRDTQRLLVERDSAAATSFDNTTSLLIFGSVVAVGLLVLANFLAGREVSRRRRAEERLQDINALHAHALTMHTAILSSANYAIISTSPEGLVTTFNATAERWLGYLAVEIIGQTTPAIWHDPAEVAARAEVLSLELGYPVEPGFEAFVAKARLGQVDENEWTFIRKDGTRFPVSLSATALFDPAGNPTGYLGVIADITESKRVSNALQEAKHFLLSTLDALSAHIAIIDEHGTIIQVNAAWNRFGQENACAAGHSNVGDNYLQLCATACGRFSEEASWVGDGIRAVMAGISGEFEAEYPCHSPTEQRWFVVRVTRFRSDGPVRVVIAHENITVRKLAEAALQRSEEILRQQQAELRLLFDFMPAIICFKDTENRILRANRRLAEPLGKSVAEIEGRSAEEIYPQDAAKYFRDDLEVIRSGQPKLGIIETFQDRDDQAIWIQTDKVPVRNSAGEIIGIIAMAQDITERRQTAERLRDSEERFRLIVEGVKDYAILMLDPEGRVTSWNSGAERIKGYSAGEIIGQHFTKFYPPEALAAGKPAWELAEALAKGQVEDEGWRVRKDGSRFFADVTITAIRDAGGQLRGFGKFTRDITERKQAEARMRESEERFRHAFDDAPIGIALVSPTGSWLRVNHVLCQMLGYSSAELLATDFQHLTHPEDLEKDWQSVQQVLAGDIPTYQMEKRYFHKTGATVHAMLSVSLVRNHTGQPLYFISQIENITQRKLAEARLRDSYREIEDLKTAMDEHAVVAITDTAGKIIYANDKFCAISKYSRAELLGQDHRLVNSGHHPREFMRDLWTTIAQGRVWRGEIKNRAKDGSLYWVDATIVPFLDADGKPFQYVAIRTDITASKLAEGKIVDSLHEKEALLREIHHRVKNNMQVISSILQLQTNYIKDPVLLDVFKDCQGRIRTMGLIHEKLYRSEGLAQVDFKEYLESLVGLLLRSQTPKGVVVRNELRIQPVDLDVDTAIPLGLIANELVCNCLKHAFTGRPAGQMQISLIKTESGRLELVVVDDGQGLPSGFDPDKTSSLGLRLVKILSRQINGTMEFKSDNGTRFAVTFDATRPKT